MNTNEKIQSMLEDVKKIFEAAHTTIDSMQTGARKQIKDLAEDVSVVVGKEAKEVLAFVNHFAHKTDIAYVTRGKHGGIVKGTKPAKVVKVKKVKPAVTDPSTKE